MSTAKRLSAVVPLLLAAGLLLRFVPPELYAGVYQDTPEELWPNGVIPYEFDGLGADNICCITAAMNVWEAATNVNFVPRDGEADYLLVQYDPNDVPRYPPPPGYRGNGAHLLILNDWCDDPTDCSKCWRVYGLVHELGHALGLYHTHQRTDRNNHVVVTNSNVDPNNCSLGDFNIANDSLAWPRNVMDIDSIMTYPLCTCSICANCSADPNNCAPIRLLEPYATQWAGNEFCPGGCGQCDPNDCAQPADPPLQCVGHRNHLSRLDKLIISFLYPLSNWRFVNKFYTGEKEMGTFHFPYKTFAGGEAGTPAGGTLWVVEPGAYPAVGTYGKAMVIKAPLGGVVLGN